MNAADRPPPLSSAAAALATVVAIVVVVAGCPPTGPPATAALEGLSDNVQAQAHLREFGLAYYAYDRDVADKAADAAVKVDPKAPYPRLLRALSRGVSDPNLGAEMATITTSLGDKKGSTAELLVAARKIFFTRDVPQRLEHMKQYAAAHPERYLDRTLLAFNAMSNDEAFLAEVNELQRLDPKAALPHILEWKVLYNAGLRDDAAKVLDEALRHCPTNKTLLDYKAGKITERPRNPAMGH